MTILEWKKLIDYVQLRCQEHVRHTNVFDARRYQGKIIQYVWWEGRSLGTYIWCCVQTYN